MTISFFSEYFWFLVLIKKFGEQGYSLPKFYAERLSLLGLVQISKWTSSFHIATAYLTELGLKEVSHFLLDSIESLVFTDAHPTNMAFFVKFLLYMENTSKADYCPVSQKWIPADYVVAHNLLSTDIWKFLQLIQVIKTKNNQTKVFLTSRGSQLLRFLLHNYGCQIIPHILCYNKFDVIVEDRLIASLVKKIPKAEWAPILSSLPLEFAQIVVPYLKLGK